MEAKEEESAATAGPASGAPAVESIVATRSSLMDRKGELLGCTIKRQQR